MAETKTKTAGGGFSKEEIIDAIGNLTVLELAELVKALEQKFGVTAAAPMAVAAPAARRPGDLGPCQPRLPGRLFCLPGALVPWSLGPWVAGIDVVCPGEYYDVYGFANR